jgi:beta-N-acetylhexosaminidase
MSLMARIALVGAVCAATLVSSAAQGTLDRDAQRWVDQTLKTMTVDQLVGQLVMPRFAAVYTSSDTAIYETLARYVREGHVGGIIAFGGEEPVPQVLLNPTYGPTVLGQPFALASMLNRLQSSAAVPLLTAADFEWGVGMRIAGGTRFPRAMAFGAAGDEQLAYEAGRITAREGRALGVHVNFAPVADVNNNPRNPVINIRSFGEDPSRVGALAGAWTRGLQQAGMIATLKHFPGHGDTSVDSHLGLPLIEHPRERLEAIELAPFKAAIATGAGAIMTAHIELPALDSSKGPATLSQPVVTGLLRERLRFDGLIFTDSMLMDGALTRARLAASVRRVLTAKARLGLHKSRIVDLDAIPEHVGGRTHAAVARQVSERAITLIKDERASIPLKLPSAANVLYLSVLDYPRGWRIAAPSRTLIPALRTRWPNLQAIEVSDASAPNELALVRAMAPRFDAIIAGVFVRAASSTNRLDLAAPVAGLLQDLARSSGRANQPFVAAFFGSPYVPIAVPEVPTMLLTYDFSDESEETAARSIAGEIPIGGRLPIVLPGLFPLGHGIDRSASGGPF